MDSYKPGKEDKQPGNTAPSGPLGQKRAMTGSLSLDSFQSTGTQALGRNGTRRLQSGPIEVEKTIQSLTSEVENGQVLVSKLEGRVVVLQRAMAIADRPMEVSKILQGVGAGEAGFTKQVGQALLQDPGTKRRVQVALYQFEQARKGVEQAAEALEKAALYEGPAKAQFVENYCHVEKLRGQLYPLINLHMVFQDHPLISQLIPAPKIQDAEELPPPPPPPPPAAPHQKTPTGPLEPIANDPAVKEVVDAFNKVTGNLKDKLFGAFGKKNQ